jgi:hypothetical protein
MVRLPSCGSPISWRKPHAANTSRSRIDCPATYPCGPSSAAAGAGGGGPQRIRIQIDIIAPATGPAA